MFLRPQPNDGFVEDPICVGQHLLIGFVLDVQLHYLIEQFYPLLDLHIQQRVLHYDDPKDKLGD